MSDPGGKGFLYIALHAVTAGAFGFLLQRFALQADMQTSLIWAAAFAVGAVFVAWRQTRR